MSAAVPIFIAVILLTACFKRVDVCAAFYEGAMENLKTAAELCPTLILLMTAGAERSARAFDIGAGLSCRVHAANADTPYIGQRVARRA